VSLVGSLRFIRGVIVRGEAQVDVAKPGKAARVGKIAAARW
jgi:hypothetical protein